MTENPRNLTPEAQAIIERYGEWLSYPQAAEATASSVRTLKRETAAGRLPCYQVGRSRTYRLKASDVAALIRRVG